MKQKKIHIKLKVNEQLVLLQNREQGPGAPVEMDTPYLSIQYDDRRTFEVMPSGADGELPQINGKLIIRNKTSSCLS